MKKRLIIVTFPSFERFLQLSDQVKNARRTLIPLRKPLPVKSTVVLYLVVPGENQPFVLHGVVSGGHPGGSELIFDDRVENLPAFVARRPSSESVSSPGAPGQAGEDRKIEWLRELTSHDAHNLAEEASPAIPEKPIGDKNTLTPQEQERVAPVGQFIMNLTKAILRTGYYDPAHPGSFTAKQGLYDEFQQVLADSRELVLTVAESRESEDISITGILDAPVSIRTIVGKGVAALFVPKLYEYFDKKKLLTLAIKKQISAAHFETFVAIMSNPDADRSEDKNAGHLLTHELVKNNIAEISTVFADDQLNFEKNLPWRVAMAMHRLAKDLKLLPLFKGVDTDVIRKMKQQSVQDIIRPLSHPHLLNDFLVNCYIIADHVENMASREIEQIVVDAFPARMLLPASGYTFAELDWLRQKAAEDADNARIGQRLQGIKRILKMIAARVALENIAGGGHFLAGLYEKKILSFEELPDEARGVINARRMADDVRQNMADYRNGLLNAQTPGDLMVYLNCFRRIAPLLIESGDWDILRGIAGAMKSVCSANAGNDMLWGSTFGSNGNDSGGDSAQATPETFRAGEVMQRVVAYVFKDQADLLVRIYENSNPEEQHRQDAFFDALAHFGTVILGRILCDSKDRHVRGRVSAALVERPAEARLWVAGVLENPNHMWFVYRNAIMILRQVSDDPADANLVRLFLDDEHPRLRLEALSAIVDLKPHDAEALIIDCIRDDDDRVNWRAMKAIAELPEISQKSMDRILSIITTEAPAESGAAAVHFKHAARLITAVNGLPNIPNARRVASEILNFAQFAAFKDKKWQRLLKRAVGSGNDTLVLKAAIPLLGRIGGGAAETFLTQLGRSYPDLSAASQQAIQTIKKREMKTQ